MIARKILEEELKAQHLNWKLNQTSNGLNLDLSGIKNKIVKNSKKSGDNLVINDEDILKYLNEVTGEHFITISCLNFELNKFLFIELDEYQKFVASYDEESSETHKSNGSASKNRRKSSEKKPKTTANNSKLQVDDSRQELKTLLSNENDISEFKD